MSQALNIPMLNIAIKAARAAGSIINRASLDLDALHITEKSAHDFVTEVDKAAERIIIETILEAYPGHGILAEESGVKLGAGDSHYRWIIDPLDGTTNFIHGLPIYCTSIALSVGDVIQHAVVYDPTRNDLFVASKGRGAYLNDRRLRVSKRLRLDQALIGTGFPFRRGDRFAEYMDVLERLMRECAGLRRPGAAALDLCYVAAGYYDGFFETGLSPWDVAAGSLIITEAGGLVGNFTGEAPYLYEGELVAGSPKIYGQLVQRLSPISQVTPEHALLTGATSSEAAGTEGTPLEALQRTVLSLPRKPELQAAEGDTTDADTLAPELTNDATGEVRSHRVKPNGHVPTVSIKPREERAAGDRPRSDRPRSDRPRDDRPRDDRPRQRFDGPGAPRRDGGFAGGPRSDRPQSDRPRDDRPRDDRPRQRFDGPGAPRRDGGFSGGPRRDGGFAGGPRSDRPQSDRPRDDRPRDDRPRQRFDGPGAPRRDGGFSGGPGAPRRDGGFSGGPRSDRPHSDRPRDDRPRDDRPRQRFDGPGAPRREGGYSGPTSSAPRDGANRFDSDRPRSPSSSGPRRKF